MMKGFQILNKDFTVELDKLDQSQEAAVISDAPEIVIRASAGSGKALLNGTVVLTINGWKEIQLLTTNDLVAAEDGKFYRVLGVYPQGLKQIYEVVFSDNSIIKCSPDHLWTWQTSYQRLKTKQWSTWTTEQLASKPLQLANGHWDVYIPQPKPIDFPEKDLPLDPYLLGALLGDGSFADKGLIFTVAEEDIRDKVNQKLLQYDCSLEYMRKYDYRISGKKGFGYNNTQDYVGATITSLGLRGTKSDNKFIPFDYKFASVEQRLELLRGIIDTDGHCNGSNYEITLKSKQLILDIQWLCESLGATAVYSEKQSVCSNASGGSKDCGVVYRLYIKASSDILKLHSSVSREKQWKKGQSSARRTIREVRLTNEFAEMTCISVDSPNHLFLTEHCIPTHNTHTLITAVAQYRYDHVNDRICAITFTRAARAEMKARLEDLGIRDVEVTTIHVWARNMLDYFADKYDIKIRVLEEKEIKAILEEIVREYIIRSRVRSVNIGVLYTYITGSKTMDITDNYRRTLNALEERYIKYKKDNGLYDFTDYPQYLWDVMVAYDEYINNIDALFVDEFQDVDTTQFNIFERVNANKKFYIGDPWQSIYIFRSADGEVFNKLDNFELFKLKYNYRSYQEIIDYATTVYNKISKRREYMSSSYITMVTDSNPCKVMCSRDYGGKVSIIDHDGDCYQFTNGICDYDISMYQALNDIFDGEEPMILCRTNKQVRALQDLGVTNVSTVHQAKGLEYNKVVVVDMEIEEFEDLNVAYVALTRARDELLVINFGYLENYLKNKNNISYWR